MALSRFEELLQEVPSTIRLGEGQDHVYLLTQETDPGSPLVICGMYPIPRIPVDESTQDSI